GTSCAGSGNTCDTCLVQSCPGFACACWANPECTGLLDCYAKACPNGVDDTCAKYCMSLNKSGIAQSLVLGHCAAGRCPNECEASGSPLNPCQECVYTKCENEVNACLSTAPCYNYMACVQGCLPNDAGCADGCVNANPDAKDAAQALRDCRISSCGGCQL